MNKKILVVLRRRDTADQMMPYLEEVAKPGMRVVFLIPYPVESSPYVKDHWIEADTARAALSSGREIVQRYSWDLQKRLAEQKITHLRTTLQNKQIEVEVEIYTGSLKRIVRDHEFDKTIHSIVTKAQSSGWMSGLVSKAIASVSRSTEWLAIRVFSPTLYEPGGPEKSC